MTYKPAYTHLSTASLTYAECPHCGRGSYWSAFPATCKNPHCGKMFKLSEEKKRKKVQS